MNGTIVIIGAGYAGTATAINLLRRNPDPGMRVVLVERRAPFGRGLAYKTWDDSQVLNVPAGNMSTLVEEPAHFSDYCRTIDPALHGGSFVPRRIYGDYLEDTLREAERQGGAQLERIGCEALAVRPMPGGAGFAVDLAYGGRVYADKVVLAIGHFLPTQPLAKLAPALGSAYLPNPWDLAGLDRIDRGRTVALIGAGHTAIDVLLRLTSRGDAGKVVLISRHGLLPHGHRLSPHPPSIGGLPPYLEAPLREGSIRAFMRAVRAESAERMRAGRDWRDVVNEMRPHTPTIWSRLAVGERRRFLQKLAPFWDIHRHRLAPSVSMRLQRMVRAGQVQSLAARLLDCEKSGDDVRLTLRERASGRQRELVVGSVVNCTGPNYDIGALQSPLVAELHGAGMIKADPLRLGFEVDEEYRLVDAQGRFVPGLFYVGPMLKALHWEAIAVPELRVHALRLAQRLSAPASSG
jgi:uncharacterized NAD(P)/FAD-binding protein YdhS